MSKQSYDPLSIEAHWQSHWDEHDCFRTPEDRTRPKFFALGMFPYPSGAGLHVGHPESYTALDIVSRYKRMNGFNVLQPMGWDAFGLPTERAALREGRHPADITRENVANFKKQLKSLGFSYDWSREINTSEPSYYRWTQWIFLKLYERGLAYLSEVPVNWCPAQGTVLANEEVQDGKYVETGDPVERRMMRQWMLRITEYAQRLLDDLQGLDWPEGVLEMQRQWIGRSDGADVRFDVADSDHDFTVFTTRPDTLWGATYCVLAPEHPLVEKVTAEASRGQVQAYVDQARNRSDLDRQVAAEKEKTGVSTGAFAINPVNGERIPIWVADYVLMSYGTGAIMAVPAHDERDNAFARTFELPIIEVVSGGEDVQKEAWSGDGVAVNSDFIDGLAVKEAKAKVIGWLEEKRLGEGRVHYKLRDWLFSRQRYWGEPFPVIHGEDGEIAPLSTEDLPLTLPFIDEFKPTETGEPPLARAAEWLSAQGPDGKTWQRETNTMPQWAGSCWYWLRYMDPHNESVPFAPEEERYWGPVDLYIGGVEHAVLHLLYARFWHKVMFDSGLVHTKEPFQRLFNQGMILAYSYFDADGRYYHPDDVEERDGAWFVSESGKSVETQVEKMSKSKLNVVNPDDVVDEYGADALRLYEMFMGPLDAVKPWQMSGVEGVSRFLQRIWRLYVEEDGGELNPKIVNDADCPADAELDKSLNLAVKAVTEGVEELRFNTPISRMMEFVKLAITREQLPRSAMEKLVLILSPYAPHLGEELWKRLGHAETLTYAPWPTWDAAALEEDQVQVVVQVKGKLRGTISVPKAADKDAMVAAAQADQNVSKHLDGKQVVKTIVVPGKLINFVVR